ncbi:hypothetical protein [Ramlibacter humi]|uniref:Uncharacterized protein n=1 Tax=Ramlibacter humi TaxID=2530451 RepID=A0A4Z0C9F5_9BURK|nr:hypothetical protein [Ramlibacter humi]TFZ07594.1 hypothetical protein EZ216_00040 [Ramlibacter humi]
MAILAAALAACGGGGGGGAVTGSGLPTGATVNAQAASTSTFTAEAAVPIYPATSGQQALLSVGALAEGGHAVAWLEPDGAGAQARVRSQRFDAQGAREGDALSVSVDALLGAPAAMPLPNGGLVVATPVASPSSVDKPWITRSAIRVQRLAADGTAVSDTDVGAVLQNRIGAATMRYVEAPALIRWDDGGFLVGWSLVDDDGTHKTPQFWVQRFDASGRAAGAASMAAQGEIDSPFALTATPNGGWLLATFHRLQGRTVLRYHPFQGASAPVLPAGAPGVAEGSTLVPLAGGGSVLLQPVQGYGALQLFAADGQPRGQPGGLPQAVAGGAALRDGGFVAFLDTGSGLAAQRFDAIARPMGGATPIAAQRNLQAAPMTWGALAIAWTATGAAGDTDAMTQRLR